jgi:hypothetical protein
MENARREFEYATALTPHDFRFWLALGKIRERTGDADGAEAALRKALELAPNYAQIRWTLGNFLLRQKRIDEAFTELRQTAEANPAFMTPTVNAALDVFGAENYQQIIEKIGSSTAVRANLIPSFAAQGKFDESLRLWNELSAMEKAEFNSLGKELFKHLIAAKRFRSALPVYEQVFSNEPEKPVLEKISNADFESDVSTSTSNNPFAWQIAEGSEPQIAFDAANRRGGARSLILVFNSVSGREFRPVSQTIAVNPGSRYRLEFYARTAGIKSSSTVRWEIANVTDEQLIAASAAIPSGDSDWQKITTDFTVLANTEGVTLRLSRVACNLPPCSLIGKIWFDDFTLSKL